MDESNSPCSKLLALLDELAVNAKRSLPDSDQHTERIIKTAEFIEHAMRVANEQEEFKSPHQRVSDVINYRNELLALRSKYACQQPEIPTYDLLTKFAETEFEIEALNDASYSLDTAIDQQTQLLSKFLEKDSVKSYQNSREKTQRQVALILVERVLSAAQVLLGIDSGAINSETGRISGSARIMEYAIKHALQYQGGIDWLKKIYLEGKPRDQKQCSKIVDELYTDFRARKQN